MDKTQDPFNNPPPPPRERDNSIKCVGCNESLGSNQGSNVHLALDPPKQGSKIQALLRPDGDLTVACPACGTLNVLNVSRGGRGNYMEKGR